MSKKNKALKQLIRAQMQAGMQGGIDKTVEKTAAPILQNQQKTGGMPVVSGNVAEREQQEHAIIGRDIQMSLLLIVSVILALLIIYAFDRQYGFLLKIANEIFRYLGLS